MIARTGFNVLVLFGLLIAASSCDYVSVPQQTGTIGVGPADSIVRRVLLEDFTGHFCAFCPPAAEEIDSIHRIYGDLVIPISIHAGNFAQTASEYGLPSGAPLSSFAADFRTPEGNEWHNQFGVFAYPMGMINRTPNSQNLNLLNSHSLWQAMISEELAKAPTAKLELTHTYNTTTRSLDLTIEGTILRDTSGTFIIKTVLVEDSIYEWQIDDRLNPNPTWSAYYHNHMLRTSIDHPGSGGGDTAITGTSIAANSTFTRTYNNVNISSNFNDQHCRIITFIYYYETSPALNVQVLQVEEVELR